MKAIRVHEFGGPETLRLEELPDPTPGPGEVLVRIKAVGVNPVDTYIRAGTYALKPPTPYIPGSDAAGIVEAVGERVRDVRPGDRVYISGTVGGGRSGAYAELALAEPSQVHRLPARVSFAQGAAVNVPYATAYRGLIHRAHAAAGESVLVHGATGGVGIAATQIAVAYGMPVIGTGGTERGRRLVLEQGARAALDHTNPKYLGEIMELTGQRGVDVILEMAAHINLANDLGLLAMRGRVVVIGNRGPIEINARAAMGKDAAILGMTLFNLAPPEKASIHAALEAGLANGTLKPIVGTEMPLADAAKAHAKVMEPGAYGKIVLVP